jgi:hypothetical protein
MTPSLHNRRGFFSDYWFGSIFSRRETAAPRLTSAKLDRMLWRFEQLCERVSMPEAPDLTTFRERFARPLLEEVWGYALADAAEDPRFRLLYPAGGARDASGPLVPAIYFCPDPEELEAAGPRQRLESLMAELGLTYGFLLSPQTLRLIRRKGEGSKGASFDVFLAGIVERSDRDSLDAARRLLHCGNFLPADGKPPPIVAMEEESLRHRARVSAALKDAVFQSAEVAIRGLLADFRQRPTELPPTPPIETLRDVGLHLLYRLLFILYAESRDERLQTHALYRRVYSLESMVDRFLQTPPDRIARNSFEQWAILQAIFRIFDEGLPPMPGLENIPPRGGPLFSRQTPEGQWLSRLRLCDEDVAMLLLGLATAKPRQGVGRERISYRELAIEQLGSVYEGLLEYEPRVAAEAMLELRVQGREFVLTPPEVVRLCREKNLSLQGPVALIGDPLLAALKFEQDAADGETEAENLGEEEETEAVDESEEESGAIKIRAPAKLVRRLEPDAFYFAPGAARKSSGSYYTVEEIVQYLCRHALGGLVQDRTPDQVLALRVIDIACGSAHFLVGAARFLGQALHDAYRRVHGDGPPPDFLPDHQAAARRKAWDADADAWCKRRIVEQCLYGVDLNPTAVQLAQVALWIESLAGDRPLSFFAHHVRCGNSLLGTRLETLGHPPLPDLERGAPPPIDLFAKPIRDALARALEARRLIEHALPAEIRPDTPEEYHYKADRLREAEQSLARAHLLFDLRSASAFVPAIWGDFVNLLGESNPERYGRARPWWPQFEVVRERERFFHWQLEFPEVFLGGGKGFDAILGNPPWEKVKPDRKEFYARADVLIRAFAGGALDARIRELQATTPSLATEYARYEDRLKATAMCLMRGGDFQHHEWEVNGRRTGGDPDLFKFVVERAHQHLRVGGRLGYLVPGAIYNTDGCTGVRHLLFDQARIVRFFGFENRQKVFDIDSRYKFVCLVAEKTEPHSPGAVPAAFEATFMRHDLKELEQGAPADAIVEIRRDELALLSPGTLALLEFRSRRDREIVLKMCGRLPGQTPRPLLGDSGPDSWGVRYYREFDMTNDKGLWTKPDGKLWTPREVCGLDWPADGSIPFAQVRAAMLAKGFWPLYEGKQIDQWLVDVAPVTRWLCLEKCKVPLDPGPKLVFRDIASNTNERTCIAAVLPERSCSGNTLATLEVVNLHQDTAAAVMNSLTLDGLTRFKTAGTHLNWTYVSRVAVPPPAALRNLNLIPTRSAASGGWRGTSDSDRIALANDPACFEELWRNEKAVAQAYGLDADDFAHILSSFPVMARKRAAFVAYMEEQTEQWRDRRCRHR